MKENEIYYKRNDENKHRANHTAIVCQPDMTQQCECKLVFSFSTENSGIIWCSLGDELL